jgi:VWFA-related protein
VTTLVQRLVIGIALLVILTGADKPPQSIPRIEGERIEVSLVNVDVVVTDKKGHRITGLTKDDFEITEDRKPQSITNFSEYRDHQTASVENARIASDAPPLEAASTLHPRAARALVVFIDDMRLPNFKKDPVFAALKSMLHETIGKDDLVMIARWRLKPFVEQQYTNNLALVDAALERASAASSGVLLDAATEVRDRQDEVIQALQAAAQASGSSTEIDPDDEIAMLDIRSRAQIAMWDMRQKAAAMNALISSMPQGTKKAFIFLSSRFSAYAGGEFFFASADAMTLQDQQHFNTTKIRSSLLNVANAHGVTIYPLYPEGLQTNATIASPSVTGDRAMRMAPPQAGNYLVLQNELTSLATIAEETGGKLAWSAVDVAKTLPLIRDDLTSYYSLAYHAPSRFDDKPRQIAVRTKNRAYVVRTRQHFVERSAQAEMRDRLTASLFTQALASRMPIDLELGYPKKQSKAKYTVPAKVRIPIKSLMTVDSSDKRKGAFSVYIATARTLGIGAEVMHETVPFTMTSTPAADQFFTYEFDVLTDFLTTRIAVAVVDELTGEIGYVRAELPKTRAQ